MSSTTSKTNVIDELLIEKFNYSNVDVRKFKFRVATETAKVFSKGNRGCKKFHTEMLVNEVPQIQSYFPLNRSKRKAETNSLTGKKKYINVYAEIEWDRAIQLWSTTVCNESDSIKTGKKNKVSKVSKVSTPKTPASTAENSFVDNTDCDKMSDITAVEFNTVISYYKEGSKLIETPSGYRVHF